MRAQIDSLMSCIAINVVGSCGQPNVCWNMIVSNVRVGVALTKKCLLCARIVGMKSIIQGVM